MIPFVPHLANECLHNLKTEDKDIWPVINKKAVEGQKISMVVQVNGRTRNVLKIKKDLNEEQITKLIKAEPKVLKYIENKKIIKTIFIKNKIINFIL